MVHVRVDHAALIRGHTEKGEICEIPGTGPIPVSAARELATDAFLKAILVDGEDVLAVAHMGRSIPAHLRTALNERDQVCVVAGCDQMCCLEYDHVQEYIKQGPASMENIVRLCHWHHFQKTYHGYRLKRVKGKWLLLDPKGPPGEAEPFQPELNAAGCDVPADPEGRPKVDVRRYATLRPVPGKAPPKKKRSRGRYAGPDAIQYF